MPSDKKVSGTKGPIPWDPARAPLQPKEPWEASAASWTPHLSEAFYQDTSFSLGILSGPELGWALCP